jgi:hypothetical protein
VVKTESKRFFFEKKKQKTFTNWATGGATSTDQDQKFFGSFFQKRTAFLASFLAGKSWMPAFAGMTGVVVRGVVLTLYLLLDSKFLP